MGEPMVPPWIPSLELQVPVDQVVLLESPQTLADLARPYGADAVDGLEVAMARANDRVQRAEVANDVADDGVRQARYPREHAVAARRDCVIERVGVARVAEHLR